MSSRWMPKFTLHNFYQYEQDTVNSYGAQHNFKKQSVLSKPKSINYVFIFWSDIPIESVHFWWKQSSPVFVTQTL